MHKLIDNLKKAYAEHPKRIIAIIVGVVVLICCGIGGIIWYTRSSDTAADDQPGRIANLNSTSTESAEAPQTEPEQQPSGSAQPSTEAPAAAASGIASRIGGIETALNALVTDGWGYPSTDQHEKELKDLGVTLDWGSMTNTSRPAIFKYSDEIGQAYAGWLKTPITCEQTAAAQYTCKGTGDYGFEEMAKADSASDHAESIHQKMATVVHGPAGSERSLLPFVFILDVSQDGNSAVAKLQDKELFIP